MSVYKEEKNWHLACPIPLYRLDWREKADPEARL